MTRKLDSCGRMISNKDRKVMGQIIKSVISYAKISGLYAEVNWGINKRLHIER